MIKVYNKDEILFREDDNGDCFYEILEGKVGVYTDYREPTEQKLTEIGAGHIVGEMALIDAFPRSATVVALADTKAEEVFVENVRDYFSNNPEKITFIMKELSERLTRLTKDYSEACETIRGLYPEDDNRKEGLAEMIKKFADYYRNLNKTSQPSAEFLRETVQEVHKDGYSKSVEQYEEGTVIFREGETGKCMYDIHSGTVGIYTNYGKEDEKLLATLSADQFFGEVGMLGGEPRTATAVVLEDDTIIEAIYQDDFQELFSKNPAKIEMVIKHLSFRIRRLTYDYVNACKLIYDAAEAELKNSVSAELKQRAAEYKQHY